MKFNRQSLEAQFLLLLNELDALKYSFRFLRKCITRMIFQMSLIPPFLLNNDCRLRRGNLKKSKHNPLLMLETNVFILAEIIDKIDDDFSYIEAIRKSKLLFRTLK